MSFQIKSDYKLEGDQPQAVDKLTEGLLKGQRYQTPLGATSTGKSSAMAHVTQCLERPTLVIAHNKTLSAQEVSGRVRSLKAYGRWSIQGADCMLAYELASSMWNTSICRDGKSRLSRQSMCLSTLAKQTRSRPRC